MQHDFSGRVELERIEEFRMVDEVGDGALDDVRIGRVQHRVLSGVHAEAHAVRARRAAERRKLRGEVGRPIEGVHGT